jgi:hypothetical protein
MINPFQQSDQNKTVSPFPTEIVHKGENLGTSFIISLHQKDPQGCAIWGDTDHNTAKPNEPKECPPYYKTCANVS